jgi:intein/homing endonuclease
MEFGEELICSSTPAGKELVYDLSTTGSNTYYANGFLVKGGG